MRTVSFLVLIGFVGVSHAQCTQDANCGTGQKCCVKANECYDPSYQSCCEHGAKALGCVHHSEYESCCDGECCKDFNQRCKEFERKDGNEKHCTDKWMTPARGFMVIGVPLVFGLLSLLVLFGSCMAAKSKAPGQIDSMFQKLMRILGFLMGLLGICVIFSPVWYHGVFTVILGAISVAVSFSRNALAVGTAWAMQYLMIMVYINPYAPNVFLTYGQDGGIVARLKSDAADTYSTSPTLWCSSYYFGAWDYDMAQRDPKLHDPQVQLFGYCGRGWATAVFIIAVLNLAVNLVLEIVTIVHMVMVIPELPFIGQYFSSMSGQQKQMDGIYPVNAAGYSPGYDNYHDRDDWANGAVPTATGPGY